MNQASYLEREPTEAGETDVESEQSVGGGSPTTNKSPLQKAIDMGEYDPQKLANFPEWQTLNTKAQFQFIKEGLNNKERLLNVQWAALFRSSNFQSTPETASALKTIEQQRHKVSQDREQLFKEYFGKQA